MAIPKWAETGQYVRLRNGRTVMRVVGHWHLSGEIAAVYRADAETPDKKRRWEEFFPVDINNPDRMATLTCHFDLNQTLTTETETMTKLYTWTEDGKEKFGTKIGQASDGMWIMEVKGSNGDVAKVDPRATEKVMPYSVGVRYAGNSTVYHFWAKPEDTWQIGDRVILDTGADSVIVTVHSVDTKSEKATKWISGFRLAGAVILPGDTAD